jgi:hypothetical protein
VYVFLLNGADPVNKDNLSGVCDYLQHIGFPRTYFGQPYHVFWFRSEIRRIHHDDPHARFAVMGFSCGANIARSLVQSLKEDGIHIDLLVYLGGDTLKNEPKNQPENACRIVNIRAHGCLWFGGLCDGADLDCADNNYLCDVGHSELPTHCETLALLTRELIGLAATVPHVKPEEKPMPPALEEAPTPRPVPAEPTAERDEWDFLKPASRLRVPENPPTAPASTPIGMATMGY